MGLPFGNIPGFPDPPDIGILSILEWILSILQWVVSVLIAVLQYVIALLNALVNALLSVFKAIGKFLLHIWTKYLPNAIKWLACNYQKARDWLKRTFGPILKWFQKVKKWYDTHILPQQLRLLRFLQAVRRVLGILRIFHIKWAAALDNVLVDIQQRIEKSIAITRGILNQIINTLALVLDPTLLIFRNVLGGSLLQNLGALKRIFGYGDNRILSASEQATIDKQHSLYFASTVKDHLSTLATSGPTSDDLDNRKAARQALTDAVNAPLPF
jgi:hypothetical protein